MHKSSFVFFISIRSGFVNCINVPLRQKSNILQMKQGFLLRIVNLINITVNLMNENSLKRVAQYLEIVTGIFMSLGHKWKIQFGIISACPKIPLIQEDVDVLSSMLFNQDLRHFYFPIWNTGLNICSSLYHIALPQFPFNCCHDWRTQRPWILRFHVDSPAQTSNTCYRQEENNQAIVNPYPSPLQLLHSLGISFAPFLPLRYGCCLFQMKHSK